MNSKKQSFSMEETSIEGVMIINPFFVEDERGYFLKSFEKAIFKDFGLENEIYEEFESGSKKNVVRGLHFQTQDPQIKIVSVTQGEIFDVAVDLRRNSPTYGKYHSCILSAENHKSFYIQRGFAHGFLVLSEYALVTYKCIGKFFSEYDSGIVWDDLDLNIQWPLKNKEDAILSQKDKGLMSFLDYKKVNIL